MLNNELKTKLTEISLETQPLEPTIKLFLKESIMEKIHYLCSKISEVEWSGILLYSVKGSIKEPKDMELHVEDIIPMDKRSAGYTEYEYNKKSLFDIDKFDDKHIDYIEEMCEEHPEVLKWKIGHKRMCPILSN